METIKINILGLRSVIDIAIKAKTKNFLFASSSAVYGDNGKKKLMKKIRRMLKVFMQFQN